jgi:hypothetical protein
MVKKTFPTGRNLIMKREIAETVALRALGWIAGDAELLGVFLGSSGAAPDDLKAAATDPDFLGSVLDFLLMDDAWIVAFCDHAGLGYETPMQARMSLPGGDRVHWT